jgi:hypothetical protein
MESVNRFEFRKQTAILLLLAAHGCSGYIPGEKAHWDTKVKEMCATDGHVQILDRVTITKREANRMRRADGNIALKTKAAATRDGDPVYLESSETLLRGSSPLVRRTTWTAARRSDDKTIARWSSYSRVGGDAASPMHDSSLTCPDWMQTWAELQAVFIVTE